MHEDRVRAFMALPGGFQGSTPKLQRPSFKAMRGTAAVAVVLFHAARHVEGVRRNGSNLSGLATARLVEQSLLRLVRGRHRVPAPQRA